MSKQPITINGVSYDPQTGMRLTQSNPEKPARLRTPITKQIHTRPQKSKTLARKYVIKGQPTSLRTPSIDGVKKSSSITKFAPATAPNTSPAAAPAIVVPHPLQTQLRQSQKPANAKNAPTPPSPKEIKTTAIAKAVHETITKKEERKSSFFSKNSRKLGIASASVAVVLIAIYVTYTNLPSLSVRIASAQAGIDAKYPTYQPSGYSLNGPISFESGEVSMKFAANAGPQQFTVEQTKTNWDSSALLENLVKAQAKDDYTTYTDSGLTIYVYGTKAAWINAGVLHTIEGDAQLTNDQIRRIATSM